MRYAYHLPILLFVSWISTFHAWAIPSSAHHSQEVLSVPRGGGLAQRLSSMRKGSVPSALKETATNDLSSKSGKRASLDVTAVAKYSVGLAVQVSAIFGCFKGIDKLMTARSINISNIPVWVNAILFYGFNLKTSVFSPLPSKTDRDSEGWEYQKRNRPSWTPPGWVFGIMWPLFVFGIRAVTAAVMVQKLGCYANVPIMALMLNLSFGNLWNTINNVDRRLGVSVPTLYGLVLTKIWAAYLFYHVDPLAGKWLAATLTWLTAAAALETNTWRINPDPDTGKPEPLYPAKKDKWKTRFRWESDTLS